MPALIRFARDGDRGPSRAFLGTYMEHFEPAVRVLAINPQVSFARTGVVDDGLAARLCRIEASEEYLCSVVRQWREFVANASSRRLENSGSTAISQGALLDAAADRSSGMQ